MKKIVLLSFKLLIIMTVLFHNIAFASQTYKYAITTGSYGETEDLSAIVKEEFGDNAEIGDFAEIKAEYSGRIAQFCDDLGLSNVHCLYNGTNLSDTTYYNGQYRQRYYYMQRHDGNPPSNFKIYDHIDNYTVCIGSWFDMIKPILAKIPCDCYTLTMSAIPSDKGSGTITPEQDCYAEGEKVKIRAYPKFKKGYHFGRWSGDLSGRDNPVLITMDSDKSISCHFEPLPSSFNEKSHGELEDPVNTATGEYYFETTDISLGGLIPINFSRYYAAAMKNKPEIEVHFSGVLGSNWIHNYLIKIISEESTQKKIIYDGGEIIQFQWSDDDGWAMQDKNDTAYILKQGDSGKHYFMDPSKELIYVFDTSNNLEKIIDRNDNTVSLTYDDDDKLQRVEDGLGRFLDFTYDQSSGSLTKVCGLGKCVNFESSDGNPIHLFTNAEGYTTTYEYENENLMTRFVYPEGNSSPVQVYSDEEYVISQTDPYNNTIEVSYDDPEEGTTSINYPDNTQVEHLHQNNSLLTTYTDSTGQNTILDYDENDRRNAVIDRIGDTTQVTYHEASGKIESITDAAGNTLKYVYSAYEQDFGDGIIFTFYNCTEIHYPDVTNDNMGYDEKGNMTFRNKYYCGKWNYSYNEHGQVVEIINPEGGIISYSYNEDSTLASMSDSETGLTVYGYDAYKRLNQITYPDETCKTFLYNLNDQLLSMTDENGHTFTYTYDKNGNQISITDPKGFRSQYEYDLLNRVNMITDKLGNETIFAYDSMGRVASITDPNGLVTSLGYDDLGNAIKTTIGDHTWNSAYDSEGVISSRTTPLGRTTTYVTDQLGQITEIKNAFGHTIDTQYNSMGKPTSVTNALSLSVDYGYDYSGLFSSVTMPTIGEVTFERNSLGLIHLISAFGGNPWFFEYSEMGRLKWVEDPLERITYHTYDDRARPYKTSFMDDTTLTRIYDGVGNIVRKLYSDGPDLLFSYDELNRIIEANDITLTRDAEGRIINTADNSTLLTLLLHVSLNIFIALSVPKFHL